MESATIAALPMGSSAIPFLQPRRSYADFLASKAIDDPMTGLTEIPDLPATLFPFQRDIVAWALRRGRAAVLAGTGLGKSLMELAWGQAVADATGGMVILFAPLAVAAQMIREAAKFGIPARLVTCQAECGPGINVTNYQKMEHFDLPLFAGVILDESSILKSTTGHYRTALITACQQIPFRLAATATPAPNDFMELGNHAEFLGVMRHTDMLSTFFAHDGGSTQNWRLKGHAESAFWAWMASWAVMLRKPSDLGYSDDGYNLPPLLYHQHDVTLDHVSSMETGLLFPMPAVTLQERIAARRDSIDERVAHAIATTPQSGPFVWWCNLNAEADAIARGLDGAVNLHGSLTDTQKENILIDFSEGRIERLVTKPGIAGFGMNWQHCADTGFVGLNDSWEQFYQAVRRFWRFGQTRPVNCHLIVAETEGATVANLRRKEADADRMAAAMVAHMSDISSMHVRGSARTVASYEPRQPVTLPSFLKAAS
jgi:hypothetical protein